MSKSYSEQLADWAEGRPRPKRRGKIAFLTVKNDVAEALARGWPVKTIWTHMRELKRIDCCYDAFRHQVVQHFGPIRSEKPPGRPPRPEIRPPASPGTGTGSQAGFTFNAAPNKEELI
jgi:hypothetical protein